MAADEKTTIIGKVGVKIYPKTDDFYRETKRDLEEAERRLDDVEVDVTLDSGRVARELRELLARLGEQARQAQVKIDTGLNTAKAVHDAKVLKKRLEKSLDDVEATVNLDQTKTVLDDLKRAELFKGLEHIEVFDPSTIRQYRARIKEINDQVRAGQKLDAQRARALAEQAQAAERAAAAEKRRQEAQAKAMRDLAAESAKVKKQINDAAEASEKMRRETAKIKFDSDFKKQAEETARLLKEIDDEVRILDRRMDFEYSVKLKGMSEAEREIEALRDRMSSAQNKLNLAVDLSPEDRRKALREIDHLRREIEDKMDNLKIGFNLDTPSAAIKYLQLKLARLARDRIVTYVPVVSKAAAAKVATTLSALSGLRGANKLITDLSDMTKNLDKSLPKIAAVSSGLLTLAGWAGTAVANLFSLGNSLAVVGQAGLALPGILGGMAVGAGVTLIALKDLNKRIPEASKGWKKLSSTIKDNFWAVAEDPIRRLGSSLFPDLLKGIQGTSTEIGKFFAAFANGLRTELGGDPLRNMFADLNKSVGIFTERTGSIAKIIRILGEAGAGELPRLAEWFGKLTDRFAAFLDKADKSGELKDWIDEGIVAMKQLGNVVKGTVRIFAGLGRAAIAGGASTLESLGKRLNDIADVISGPRFQTQMVATLKAANDAMSDIARISGPAVTNMFMTLGKTLESVFPILGRTVGLALKTVSDALANPRLQQGIIDFFSGIEGAVKTLAPAFDSVAPALGNLLTLLGTMADAFAPIGKVILDTVAKAFIALAPHLESVVRSLSGGVLDIIKQLSGPIQRIADAAGPAIEAVATALGNMAKALAPEVGKVAGDIATFLEKTFKTVTPADAKAFADGVGALAKAVLELIDALLKGGGSDVQSFDLGGFLQRLGDSLSTAAAAIQKFNTQVGPLIKFLKELDQATTPTKGGPITGINENWIPEWLKKWQGLLSADTWKSIGGFFRDGFVQLNGLVEGFFQTNFVDPWNKMWENPWGTTNWGPNLLTKVQEGLQPILDWITGTFYPALMNVLSSDGTWAGVGRDIMAGLKVGIVDSVADLLTAWNTVVNQVITFVKGLFGIHSPSTVFAEIGLFLIQGLVQGITSATGLTEAFTTLIAGIRALWDGASTWLTEKGAALVNGLRNGITPGPATSKMGEVKAAINNVLSNAGSFLDPRGGQLVTGLAGGMGKLMDRVKDKGKAALAAAKSGTNGSDTTLNSAGTSVIDGFVRYIERGFSKVRDTLSRLTNLLPEWKGPRSTDQVILKEAGELVIQGFITGLESQFSSVKDSLGSLSDEIGKTELAAPTIASITPADMKSIKAATSQIAVRTDASAGPADQATQGGITFNIENNNPVNEPTSVTITKALRTAGQMGVVRR